MQFIVGNDISQAQGNIDWPVYKDNANFVVIKASEGVHYIDSWFGNNRAQARAYNLPRVFYHVIRPDLGNTPEDEAQWLLDLLNGDPLKAGECIALDMESPFVGAVEWTRAWLDYIYQKTGIKSFIYLNQSLVKQYDWSPVINAGYPLWLASYQADGIGEKGLWEKMSMQQTTSSQTVPGINTDVDRDIFFGTAEELLALGYKEKIQNTGSPSTQVPNSENSTPAQQAPYNGQNSESAPDQSNQEVKIKISVLKKILSLLNSLVSLIKGLI